MEQISLYTRFDEFVTTVEAPALVPPAEVILWGQRAFLRTDDGRYCERLVWVVPPTAAPVVRSETRRSG